MKKPIILGIVFPYSLQEYIKPTIDFDYWQCQTMLGLSISILTHIFPFPYVVQAGIKYRY